MRITYKLLAAMLLSSVVLSAMGQTERFSASMIASHGREWSQEKKWDYVSGLVSKTILEYCSQYPDDDLSSEAYQWCKAYADAAINPEGEFYNFKKGSLDNIASGKVLISLYRHERGTDEAERYRKAAQYLYDYLRHDYTRISLAEAQGCFIHKDSYPYQMWLDGLYMGAAFYAEYLAEFAPDDTEGWDDIALQFITIHSHTYDSAKALNYHAWSAKPTDSNSFWARRNDPYKGCSKEFWGRGMGWYAAAIVDVLSFMPSSHPAYEELGYILQDVAEGIALWQDAQSGVWYQLLQYDSSFVSRGGRHNYLEASASCMFTYALLKGLRLGLLDEEVYRPVALKAYEGVLDTFISPSASGIDINQICRSAGLGPAYNTERDGTADYYLDGSDVTIVSNEGKGIGSFIMASLEYERQDPASRPSILTDQKSTAEYYDLMGRRMAHPSGLMIKRTSDGAEKVFIRK